MRDQGLLLQRLRVQLRKEHLPAGFLPDELPHATTTSAGSGESTSTSCDIAAARGCSSTRTPCSCGIGRRRSVRMTLRDALKRPPAPAANRPLPARSRNAPSRRRVLRSSRPATRLRYGLARLVPCPARAPPALPRRPPAADSRFLLHARLLAGAICPDRRVERRLPGLRGVRPRTASATFLRDDPVLRQGARDALPVEPSPDGPIDLLLEQRPVQPLGCLALLLPHPPLPAAARSSRSAPGHSTKLASRALRETTARDAILCIDPHAPRVAGGAARTRSRSIARPVQETPDSVFLETRARATCSSSTARTSRRPAPT